MDSQGTLSRARAASDFGACFASPHYKRSPSSAGLQWAGAKRALDLVLGGTLLLLTLPLFVMISILIKLTSVGPVLYKQTRCAHGGKHFTILKFRSMVDGAEELRTNLWELNVAEPPMFKIRCDPRVSPLGRILRRTSLDELPQLLNVLRGDMSLVGPRPAIPSEVSQYNERQLRRLGVKPGLTGLWQVSGRSLLSYSDWVDLDLRYIDHWSFGLDLKILFKTIPAVLSGRGAW